MTTMTTVSREYWFSAAHRLEGHPKCGRLHGHNYKVVVTVGGPVRDGMVIDFGKLDDVVKPLIEALDHRYLVSNENVARHCPYYLAARREADFHVDVVRLDFERSTAEHIAEHLCLAIRVLLSSTAIYVERIDVWETPKSVATITT